MEEKGIDRRVWRAERTVVVHSASATRVGMGLGLCKLGGDRSTKEETNVRYLFVYPFGKPLEGFHVLATLNEYFHNTTCRFRKLGAIRE